MSDIEEPRVRIQETATRGEIIEIKTLVLHAMENGMRKDAVGNPIPRNILHSFRATFNGQEIFSAEWFPAISANPFQAFYARVMESGTFEFTWTADDGTVAKTTASVKVV
jgi:sulfur-oxidizing protein SoxZ